MGVEIILGLRTIVRVTGEIDMSNVTELDGALDRAAGESPDGFVIDMAGVKYIDGMGFRAILAAYHRVRSAGGGIALVARGEVRRMADVLGMEELPNLLLCEDVRTAQEALSSSKG